MNVTKEGHCPMGQFYLIKALVISQKAQIDLTFLKNVHPWTTVVKKKSVFSDTHSKGRIFDPPVFICSFESLVPDRLCPRAQMSPSLHQHLSEMCIFSLQREILQNTKIVMQKLVFQFLDIQY